jgi:phosphoglycerate kinase
MIASARSREAVIAGTKNGDILCPQNTRFHIGEEKNDPAYVDALAALGDIWIDHAFSVSHRARASTEGSERIRWPPRFWSGRPAGAVTR